MTTVRPSRRERLREETLREIQATGRRQLVTLGPGGISLRGIAREMGMTAPGLYRYYASLDELIAALISDCYDEATAAMAAARDARPAGDLTGRLLAVSRAFRSWAVGHPAEFGLIFGAPPAGFSAPPDGPAQEAGSRFGAVFQDLFVAIWTTRGVPEPAKGTLARPLTAQLERYAAGSGVPLPAYVVYVLLSCWVRIYGAVAMEVFGHLRWALEDAGALFETELRQLATLLGLGEDYRPPAATRRR